MNNRFDLATGRKRRKPVPGHIYRFARGDDGNEVLARYIGPISDDTDARHAFRALAMKHDSFTWSAIYTARFDNAYFLAKIDRLTHVSIDELPCYLHWEKRSPLFDRLLKGETA